MPRCDPIGNGKETSHKLGSDNETREKIVESDKDAGKDLSRRHTGDQTHKGLPKVGVNRQIKGEDSLEGKRISSVSWVNKGMA